MTAASELARNTLEHGGGGEARLEALQEGNRRGVRLTFVDQGPGIPDLEQSVNRWVHDGKWNGAGIERLEAPRE